MEMIGWDRNLDTEGFARGTGGCWPPGGRLKIRGSPRAHLVVVAASIACIVAGAVIVAQLGWFLHDSSVHGTGLIHRARRAIAAAAADGAACLGPVGDAAAAGAPATARPPQNNTQTAAPRRIGTHPARPA